MYKARMVFEKKEKAALISHLDLMKCFQRAFIRADVPVRYSQGFNPHIYLSVLLPLSLGYEGEYEIADFDLTNDFLSEDFVERMNLALPEGLRVKKAGQALTPVSDVCFSSFEISFKGVSSEELSQIDFAGQSVEKRSKRGTRLVNVGDYISSFKWSDREDGAVCSLIMKAGEEQLNPAAVAGAIQRGSQKAEQMLVRYTRTAFYNKKMQLFF